MLQSIVGFENRGAPDIRYPAEYRIWLAGYPAVYRLLKIAEYQAKIPNLISKYVFLKLLLLLLWCEKAMF
jgi:hypothetical protein